MGLFDAAGATDDFFLKFFEQAAIGRVGNGARRRAMGELASRGDKGGIRSDPKRLASADDLKFEVVSFRRVGNPVEQWLQLDAWHGARVHSAGALTGSDVQGSGVVAQADIPRQGRRVKVPVLPLRVGFGFAADLQHLVGKGNQPEIGIGLDSGARVHGRSMRLGDDSQRALVGMHHIEVGRFANDRWNLAGDDFAEVLAFGHDVLDAVKTDFLVGSCDKVKRLSELMPIKLSCGGEHAGDGAFHVAAAASVKSFIQHGRLKWPKFIREPAGDRNDIRMAEVGESAVPPGAFFRWRVSLAGDEVDFDDTSRIAVTQFLNEEAELGQLHLQVLGDDSVGLMADRLQPNHSLCVSESFHEGVRGR